MMDYNRLINELDRLESIAWGKILVVEKQIKSYKRMFKKIDREKDGEKTIEDLKTQKRAYQDMMREINKRLKEVIEEEKSKEEEVKSEATR